MQNKKSKGYFHVFLCSSRFSVILLFGLLWLVDVFVTFCLVVAIGEVFVGLVALHYVMVIFWFSWKISVFFVVLLPCCD